MWDFTVPVYHNYLAAGVVNHNSGKTSYSARAVVKAALSNPGSLIYCFSQNNEISVQVQQSAIYNYLPAELKQKALGDTEYISYSIHSGFSGNKVVFKNKSQIVFKYYSQYQQDQSILEGMELGSREPTWENIGAWCDEYLRGMDMLDRLYLRLASRGAKLVVTFTAKDGLTETVRYYLDGAVDAQKRTTSVLKDIHNLEEREIPYVQENKRKKTGIVYFHSADNPWSGYEALKTQCAARNDVAYTLTALYGVPSKSSLGNFPRFGPHNIVPHENIDQQNLTRYMCIDPGQNKNWFIVWVGVDPTGTWYIYDEWPGMNIGPWAEDKNGKWVYSDGATSCDMGYDDYVQVIKNKEPSGREVEHGNRLIDPRMGTAKYTQGTRQSDIRQELDERGVICAPAPGLHEADGLQKLRDLMAYNPQKPIDGLNRPKFYISNRCENTINAIMNYDPSKNECEALSDPIDCLRYLATDNIYYQDPKGFKVQNKRKAGY